MSIGPDLRTFLLNMPSLTAIIGDRVFQNKVPQLDERAEEPTLPYVWFARSGREHVRTLDDPVGELPFVEDFDLECCSYSVDEALDMAEIINQNMDNYAGDFGTSVVQYVEIQDQDDSYFPRNTEADIGVNVSALYVRIMPLYEVN